MIEIKIIQEDNVKNFPKILTDYFNDGWEGLVPQPNISSTHSTDYKIYYTIIKKNKKEI